MWAVFPVALDWVWAKYLAHSTGRPWSLGAGGQQAENPVGERYVMSHTACGATGVPETSQPDATVPTTGITWLHNKQVRSSSLFTPTVL